MNALWPLLVCLEVILWCYYWILIMYRTTVTYDLLSLVYCVHCITIMSSSGMTKTSGRSLAELVWEEMSLHMPVMILKKVEGLFSMWLLLSHNNCTLVCKPYLEVDCMVHSLSNLLWIDTENKARINLITLKHHLKLWKSSVLKYGLRFTLFLQ